MVFYWSELKQMANIVAYYW